MTKLDHLGWVVYRSYGVGPYQFGVRTTSRSFGAWLDSSLSAYRIEEKTEPYLSVVVAEDGGPSSPRGFHILYRRTDPIARTLDLARVQSALWGEFESCTYPERRDAIYANAALVRADGQNVLVPSVLAAGLSGLGRRVERAGVTLPLNMSVAIDPASGAILPLSPTLAGSDKALGDGGGTGNGDGSTVGEPIRVDAVFTVESSDMAVQPISRARALHHFASITPNLPCMPRDALEGLGRLISGARCYQLSTGSVRTMLDSFLLAVRGSV